MVWQDMMGLAARAVFAREIDHSTPDIDDPWPAKDVSTAIADCGYRN